MSLRSADTLALRKGYLNNGNWPRNKDFQKIIKECDENIVGPCALSHTYFWFFPPCFGKKEKVLSRVHLDRHNVNISSKSPRESWGGPVIKVT